MAVTSLWPIHGTLKAVVDYTKIRIKQKVLNAPIGASRHF